MKEKLFEHINDNVFKLNSEACWKTHKQIGLKPDPKPGHEGEFLPKCVPKKKPKNEDVENVDEDAQMAASDLDSILHHANEIKSLNLVTDESELEDWIKAKLTIANQNLISVFNYLNHQATSDGSTTPEQTGIEGEQDLEKHVCVPIDEEDEDLCEMKLIGIAPLSEALKYHLDNKIPLSENVFRTYSDGYFNLINEVRKLYFENKIELCGPDAELVESNLGKKGIFEGREVHLDAPIEEEEDIIMEAKHRGKNVKLNKPFRTPGGPKKYAVYVKSKKGNIKKVTFGDPKMRVKGRSKARRKSFAARHKCSQKKDRTTAGYWSCRAHRIKSLGNKGKGKYW